MATTIEYNNKQSKDKAREILSLVPLLRDEHLAELIAKLHKIQMERNMMSTGHDTVSI